MADCEFYRLAREVHILCGVITKVAHQAYAQRLSENDLDISVMQYGVLRTLSAHPYTLSELSRKFVVDPSTLVPVIDTLERKGLLERGRDPNDRRRTPLNVTDAGRVIAALDIIAAGEHPLVQALQALGAEQAAQLATLLRAVMRGLPEGEATLEELSSRFQTETFHGSARTGHAQLCADQEAEG